MQPLGRKPVQIPDAKHHPKEKGKNIKGWWEHIASENKAEARRDARAEIEEGIDNPVEMCLCDHLDHMIEHELRNEEDDKILEELGFTNYIEPVKYSTNKEEKEITDEI